MSKYAKFATFILLFLIVSAGLSYKLTSSFNFHPDFARDIYDMLAIIQGNPTLIGPKLSLGGIYSGPYYYYFFVPIFYLSNLNIDSLLMFNTLLFVFALMFFYKSALKKHPILPSLLGTLTIGLIPVYVLYSRSPWNGATYLPFLLVFLTLLYFDTFENKKIKLFLLGLLGGAIVTVHLVSMPVVILATLYLLYFMKKKVNIFYFLIGGILAFAPLVLFELKHDFIMFKNTFITKSYMTFIENKNIPGAVSGKKNILENALFIFNQLSSQLGVSLLLYIGAFTVFWKRGKKKEHFLIISSLLLFLFLTFFLRFQFGAHYLLPISVFLVFTLVLTILNTKYSWLLIVILLLQAYSFPRGIYSDATRKAEKYEKAVNYTIEKKIIQKGDSFNVIEVSRDFGAYVPTGHEYRFFLRRNNYIPKTEFEYNISDILLIFSDEPTFNLAKLDNWEVNQFGRSYFKNAKKYKVDQTTIYKISK